MALFDIFKPKSSENKESNALFGQTALGNNIVYTGSNTRPTVNTQILYVTSGTTNSAGRPVDITLLSRNSTIMSCVAAKARALSQLPIRVMSQADDGTFVDAIKSADVGARDKAKAKQVISLLSQPNNFQTTYEFWYQWMMWYELSGDCLLYTSDAADE